MSEKPFYHEYSFYNDAVKPGERIKIERNIEYNDYVDALAPYVTKGVAALEQERKVSVAKEQEIFARLEAGSQEWAKQAAQTLIIDKALDYLNIPTIQHTSNQWTVDKHGQHEISNMVYKMFYTIEPDIVYSPGHPDLWIVTWGVSLNIQDRVAKRVGPRWIAEQKKKKFEGQAAAEKYVQGRIAAYAHLFTELSPPVPEDKVWLFRINGHLLPGYTIAPHEPTPDELLAFVNEQDISGAEIFKKPPARKEVSKPKRGKAR